MAVGALPFGNTDLRQRTAMDFVEAGLKTYLLVVGTLIAVGGLFALRRSWRLLSDGERTSGTVVGWDERHDKMEDSYTYMPRVSYRGADGRMAEFTSWTGSGRKTYAVGEEVPIRLISGSPDKAEIARPGWMIGGPLLMIALAAATRAAPYLERDDVVLNRLGIHVGAKV